MSHPPPNPPAEAEPCQECSPGRRRVLNGLLGITATTWLGSVAYPVVRFLIPPEGPAIRETSVKVGVAGDFKPNSGTMFRIGNKPGLLVRTATGEFRAFIAICTHLDCTVQFKQDEGLIWCACHNGHYNMQGTNISGPPPRPLQTLKVALQGEEVHVSMES